MNEEYEERELGIGPHHNAADEKKPTAMTDLDLIKFRCEMRGWQLEFHDNQFSVYDDRDRKVASKDEGFEWEGQPVKCRWMSEAEKEKK